MATFTVYNLNALVQFPDVEVEAETFEEAYEKAAAETIDNPNADYEIVPKSLGAVVENGNDFQEFGGDAA